MAYSRLCTQQAPSTVLSNLENERHPELQWRDTRTAAQCLSHLCLSKHLSDITFTFSAYRDVKLPAHKFVLSMRSEVFEAMFYGLLSERGNTITIKDIKPDIMKTVLKFVYNDKPEINGDNVLPCFYAAKKYNLSGLITICSDFLENNIDEESVCEVHEHAVFYEMKPLQGKCLAVIIENAARVLSTPGFLSLSQASLLNILQSEQLTIGEIDVFQAAMRWAEHKCIVNTESKIGQNMRNQLKEAVFQIRFPMIPIKEFARVVAPSKILTEEELLMLFDYNATNGSTPLGTFRHEQRLGAPFTVDLRKHSNEKSDIKTTSLCYSLQVKCLPYVERYSPKDPFNFDEDYSFSEGQDDWSLFDKDGLTFKINCGFIKIKSITGWFVRSVKNITYNEKNVTDYKVIRKTITFGTPIDMFDGGIIQFNTGDGTADQVLPYSEKKHVPKISTKYKCTIVQFPTRTKTITFLK